MNSTPRIRLSTTLCLAALACAMPLAQAQSAAPLPAGEVDALLGCAIPLATAEANLKARGYSIASTSAQGFVTGFKVDPRDTKTFLLGSLQFERARQYAVSSQGSGIRFVPTLRETDYPHESRGVKRVKTSEFALPLVAASAATLKDMQGEVCAGIEAAADLRNEISKPRLEDYLLNKCKAGDTAACDLLRPR